MNWKWAQRPTNFLWMEGLINRDINLWLETNHSERSCFFSSLPWMGSGSVSVELWQARWTDHRLSSALLPQRLLWLSVRKMGERLSCTMEQCVWVHKCSGRRKLAKGSLQKKPWLVQLWRSALNKRHNYVTQAFCSKPISAPSWVVVWHAMVMFGSSLV